VKARAVALFVATLLAPAAVVTPASAQPADGRAHDAETEALESYLAFRFLEAEHELQAAVELCGEHDCSTRQRAHLHLTLGFVLGAGEKNLDGARAEFDRALRIDAAIRLEPDMKSRDLSRVFEEAERDSERLLLEPAPRPRTDATPAPETHEAFVFDGQAPRREAPAQPSPSPDRRQRDSIALVAAADLAFVPSVGQVCSPGGAADWSCFDGSGGRYAGTPQPNMDNNNTKAGLEFSTVRLAAAYDRVITDRIALGLRLGWAFNGGPTPPGGSAFLPVHVEARATYSLPGFRVGTVPLTPFAFLSGGVAEVDTRVNVAVVEVPCSVDYTPRCVRWLSAWHRAGYGFVGTGLGVRYAVGAQGAVVADLRASVTLGSTSFVASPEVGYAYRF
jgi:hypothetical protein